MRPAVRYAFAALTLALAATLSACDAGDPAAPLAPDAPASDLVPASCTWIDNEWYCPRAESPTTDGCMWIDNEWWCPS